MLHNNWLFHEDIWHHQLRDALIYWFYIPAAVILSGKIIDTAFSLNPISSGFLLLCASMILITSGLAVIWRAMKDFSLYGNGSPNPRRPSRILVTRGMYSVCRHPMFLGYDLAALGVVLLFHSSAMLFISYPLFILLEFRFLKKEENILRRRFRERFNEYADNVDFLVPLKFIARSRT